MLKLFNLSNLFLFLFVIYFAQGAFYENGSIISRISLVVVLLISIYCGIRVLGEENKSFFIWSLYLFIVMYIIGTVGAYTVELTSLESNPIDYLKHILTTLTPFFAGYYFSINKKLNEKIMLVFFLFLVIETIFGFNFRKEQMLLKYSFLKEDVTNNIGYNFVALLLFIPLFSKRIYLGYAGIVIFLYYIMIAAKRGAIIAGVLLVLLNVFYLLISSGNDVKKILKSFFIGIVGLVIIGLIAYFVFQNSEYLQKRLEQTLDGNSSYRDTIYSTIWYAWYNSDSVWNYLFGLGYLSSLRIAGRYAHNDWLELLSSFGMCGVFIYLLFFIGLFKIVLSKSYTFEQRYIVLMFSVYLGLKSLVSMGYMVGFPTGIGLILVGYVLGKDKMR